MLLLSFIIFYPTCPVLFLFPHFYFSVKVHIHSLFRHVGRTLRSDVSYFLLSFILVVSFNLSCLSLLYLISFSLASFVPSPALILFWSFLFLFVLRYIFLSHSLFYSSFLISSFHLLYLFFSPFLHITFPIFFLSLFILFYLLSFILLSFHHFTLFLSTFSLSFYLLFLLYQFISLFLTCFP